MDQEKTTAEDVRFKDSEDELRDMAEFYSREYSEVYFIRDLKVNCIVAVEAYPARNDRPYVMRNGRKYNFMVYKNRLMSTRERYDKTPDGKFMIGYESISGNDTRLSNPEKNIIPSSNRMPADAVANYSIGGMSPFEISQRRSAVALRISETKYKPDYELRLSDSGKIIERYETFEIERMK